MSAALVAAAITALDGVEWMPPLKSWEIAPTDKGWGVHGEVDVDNEDDAYAFLRNVAETARVELEDDGRLVTVSWDHSAGPVRLWWLRPIVRWVVPERCATCPTKLGAPEVQFVRLGDPDGAVICLLCRDAMHRHWVAAAVGESVSETRAVTALAALVHRSQEHRETSYGIAMDVDRAQMLMSPETAEELDRLRKRAAELESTVAGMHAAAVGEVMAPELGLVEDVRVLRASFLAQKSRADVLDGMARRAQAAGGLFLAEYDGVPPELHTTVEAARDMCDDVAKVDAHGRYWDWTVQDGVHVQVWTHPDDDRPLSVTSGVVTPIEVRPAVVPAAAAQLAGMVDAADALRADRAEGGAS
ncbi:hypothetical protein ACFVTT_23515 [Streptomyces niveus]|uniref:hypothetical protein n=1 Tax=Streptomyces niveus TaxID=193462 RepID=UPI003428C518